MLVYRGSTVDGKVSAVNGEVRAVALLTVGFEMKLRANKVLIATGPNYPREKPSRCTFYISTQSWNCL